MIEGLIGIFSGALTATGLGGGTILILLLSLFLNVEQHIAQSINLIFYIPTAVISSVINIKNGLINLKLCMTIIVSGVIGSILGAIISINLEVNILRKIFGIFLMCILIYEIYNFYIMYIKKKKENNKNRKTIKN